MLELIADLRDRLGLSIVFITHDLRVAARVCDQIAVMHRGEVVEHGTVEKVFADPRHPYNPRALRLDPGPRLERAELGAAEGGRSLRGMSRPVAAQAATGPVPASRRPARSKAQS